MLGYFADGSHYGRTSVFAAVLVTGDSLRRVNPVVRVLVGIKTATCRATFAALMNLSCGCVFDCHRWPLLCVGLLTMPVCPSHQRRNQI